MSQAGYTPIQLYFSTTAAAVPVNTNLANGELAINITDEKLYFKNAAGVVKLLASNATSAPVLSFSAGTTGFTPSTATSGAITLAGTLATTNGGTGLTAFTANQVFYASSTSAFAQSANLTFNGTTLTANTIGAFTLGGTIAGGGNQINNVIIGTSTPLAGSFTSLKSGSFLDSTAVSGAIVSTTQTLIYAGGVNSGSFSTGGLAVTGTLSAIKGSAGQVAFFLSGNSAQSPYISFGRAAEDVRIQIAAATNDLFTGTVAGDYATNSNASIWFGSGGTPILKIASSGNVGIGTISPATKLHAYVTATSATEIARFEVSGDTTPSIGIYSNGAIRGKLRASTAETALLSQGATPLLLGTNDTEYFRIASTGAFGLSGANYGTSGQVLTSGGSGAAPTWTTVGGGGGGSPATPTVAGTVFGSMTASGASPYLTALGYNAGAATTGARNVFVGVSAGQSNVAGTDSIAIGYEAMKNYSGTDGLNIAIGSYALTTATTGTSYYNVAVGIDALKLNTSGYGNIAMGFRALSTNTSGRFSVAIGYNALRFLETGNDGSTAVGTDSCSAVTTGIYNVGFGGSSISSVTTGSYNTAIGYGALGGGSTTTSSGNTAVGYGTLVASGVKTENTVVGYQAGYSVTTGDRNTALGAFALNSITGGSSNVAIGHGALDTSASGNENVAIGRDALGALTNSSGNTAVGYRALYQVSSANSNTAIGYLAGSGGNVSGTTLVGYESAKASTDGNTALGYQTGLTTTSGYNNIYVGYQAGTSHTTGAYGTYIGFITTPSSATVSSELVICSGYNGGSTVGKGADTGFIKGGSGGVYQGNNSSSWSTTSDQRLKKNIVDNNDGLDKINSIRVRNFEYRVAEEITELPKNQVIQKTGVQLGVIAQELQAVLPDCVKTESTGVLSIDTDNLTWYLVNAIKQLKAEIDQLKGNV